MKPKKIISPLLIGISLILLIGFNLFWLKKSYFDQKNILQKEIDSSLEKSYIELQDSLIRQQFVNNNFNEKIKKSKAKPKKVFSQSTAKFTMNFDTNRSSFSRIDTANKKIIQIHISNSSKLTDTNSNKMLSKVLRNFQSSIESPELKNIFVRIDSTKKSESPNKILLETKPEEKTINHVTWQHLLVDSTQNIQPQKNLETNILINLNDIKLDNKQLEKKFNLKLQISKIPLHYNVSDFNNKNLATQDASMAIYPKENNKEKSFIAVNQVDYEYYLVKKILPEILFSLFLITITSLAFGMMFQNLKKQEKLATLKNDFISNVTHELKTPITTVGVAIEALNNFNVLQNQEKTKEYLEISKNELNRLSLMVDKVLKTAIFEQKDIELKFERNDLKHIVEKVISTMKLQFEKYNAIIDFDFKGENFEIDCDNIHLTNVIYNLIENALKYSKNPQILMNVAELSSQLIFTIKDNGLGISREYQTKIFDKFFRVPSGDVHDIKGYGLGLSYVKSVVEKHSGNIELESQLGMGTTFRVILNKA